MQYRGFFEDWAAAEMPGEFDVLTAGFVILRLWQRAPADRRDFADTAMLEAVHRAVGAVSPRLRECAALDAAYVALVMGDTGVSLRRALFEYAEIIAPRARAAAYDVLVTIAIAAEQAGAWDEARRAHLAAADTATRGDAKAAARHLARASVAARAARTARKPKLRSDRSSGAGTGDAEAARES